MSTPFGMYGPRFPRLGRIAEALSSPVMKFLCRKCGLFPWESRMAQESSRRFREKINAGETIYLLGISPASHNTGASLVECSQANGIRVVGNEEEERFLGEKHCTRFPYRSLESVRDKMVERNIGIDRIHAVLGTWDYSTLLPMAFRTMAEHAPSSLLLPRDGATLGADPSVLLQALQAPHLLSQSDLFSTRQKVPVIMMPHHDNHAYLGYATSPFIGSDRPTLIAILDGFGDRSAISIYEGRGHQVAPLFENHSIIDSLGVLFGIISSTQGGWAPNSSEGRYMGAAAWGNRSRVTNSYYRRLREILHLGANGQIFINRCLAGWHLRGQFSPYQPALTKILGDPIPSDKMWRPDAVLNVDDIKHAEITADRVDRAAALQLVFEDGLFHVVEYWLRERKAEQLILSGGTALNCVANMHLLNQFNEDFYLRYVGRRARLQLWVPPTPGDAGVPIGAAISFAMRNGVRAGAQPFASPYICGKAATALDISSAVEAFLLSNDEKKRIPRCVQLGSVSSDEGRNRLAYLMALAVAQNGVIGIFQGPAETGPRALGNRSILANPCNADTLALINSKVKFRERIRPLAPMATQAAAEELFQLSNGANAASYSAYNYMILTAPARKIAYDSIPAVIHKDGTSRIQIVRQETNPLMYAYLLALGKTIGVEVSVNTSLNVGTPIVQTVEQALDVLFRAKALDGLIMVSQEGEAVVAWLEDRKKPRIQTPMERLLNEMYPNIKKTSCKAYS